MYDLHRNRDLTFPADVRYTPVFYVSIAWVLFGSVFAFAVMSRKLYGRLGGFVGG